MAWRVKKEEKNNSFFFPLELQNQEGKGKKAFAPSPSLLCRRKKEAQVSHFYKKKNFVSSLEITESKSKINN